MDLGDRARDALKQEVAASINAFKAQLAREVSSYTTWLTAVKAWETKQRCDFKELAEKQHEAITAETVKETHLRYKVKAFTDKQECQTCMARAVQKVAEVEPPMGEHEILRVNVMDLSKYGQHHSRYNNELNEFVAEELRENPATSCFIIFPPHFTAWGETMDATDSRDAYIQKATEEAYRVLTAIANGVVSRDCHLLFDKNSLSENSSRPLPVHFLMLIINQKAADGVTP